jgi:signal transduction histidine kinase
MPQPKVAARASIDTPSAYAKYAVAAAAVLGAALIRGLLAPALLDQSPMEAFTAAVVVSAAVGGVGPGIFAVLISLPIGAYFFLEPHFAFGPLELPEAVALGFFAAIGWVISVTVGRMRSALQAAKESERAEQQAKQARLNTLALVSHDVRNPLAAIQGALAIMRSRRDREAGERARAVVERQVSYLAHLVNDLTDSVRIERDGLQLQHAEVLLNVILEHAVETSRASMVERRQKLTVATPPEPVTIIGDATRLQQALSNILTNASNYTPPSGEISVDLAYQHPLATIRIRDSGAGLTSEQIARIFNPYFRAATDTQGLGLGLFITHHVIERHGGSVRVESDGLNQGTTFIISLPATIAPPVSPAESEAV